MLQASRTDLPRKIAKSILVSAQPEVGKLRSLQGIDLGNSFLHGAIPESLCNIKSLSALTHERNSHWLDPFMHWEFGQSPDLTAPCMSGKRLLQWNRGEVGGRC